MANWFKNIFGRGSRSRAVVPAPPPTRTNIMYDAWQKVTNAPLTDFSPQELAGMKYSNRAGYMVELERLYSTMYHEWPTLQKDLSDVAESVAMLDWSVSPAVDDGGQPRAKAREVADVVSRAIWARLPQKPGTFTHGFLELIEAAVHGYYRGVNVHEIRWQFTKDLAFPAGFEPVWPQYYMWEMRCGEEDRLMMVPDGCDYSNPVPFPPHKFVLAMNNSGPDHPMYNGVLYSLLGYFLAAKCGLPWLQEYVLRYGHPIRKFTVQSKDDERKLREELELNDDLMDVFLRKGRDLDITAIPAGTNIPHEVLLKLAENMCHQVILGQTLTSDTSEDGGSRAQAQVHERVQNSVILKRAEWVCRLLNRGLVLDIVAMNYGEDALSTLPLPEIKCSLPDEGLNIDRVQVCKELLAIPGFAVAKSFIYEFLRIPMPAEGEDTFNTPEPPAHDHGGFGGLFGGMGGNTPPDGAGTPPKGTEDGTEGSTPTAAQQRENERKSEQEGVNAANTDPASMAREHDAATMALLPRVAGDWLAPVLDKLEDMLQAGMSPQQVYARLHELTPNTAALEQAMEAVLKSGLGLQTDGVKAENPYGCNQYGEGWSEPHNGNSTGYKNMSPFNPKAPASKVLTNEADGNTVEQSTHSKYVGKDAYPDASNKGRDKEAEDAKREEVAKKKAENHAWTPKLSYTTEEVEQLAKLCATIHDDYANTEPQYNGPEKPKAPSLMDYYNLPDGREKYREAYADFRKEHQEYTAKYDAYLKEHANWKEQRAEAARAMLEIPKSEQKDFSIDFTKSRWSADEKDTMTKELGQLARFVNPARISGDVVVQGSKMKNRCYFDAIDKSVHIARSRVGDTQLPHEVVHLLEDKYPEMNQKTIDYLLARARSDGFKMEKLSKLTGDSAYKTNEVAFIDELAGKGNKHYAGKMYTDNGVYDLKGLSQMSIADRESYLKKHIRTTDLLTMGTERLITNPTAFAKEDPEYFKFVLQTLRS